MFNKLLSNLPFNPSLIDQVSFYARRLRRESGVRRTGFSFVALAMMVQVFAVLAPAEASRSCDPSNNDIIQCGFSSRQEAVDHCNGSGQSDAEFRAILFTRGITCDKLATSTERTISTREYGNKLISVGRKPFNKPGEFSENLPVIGNVFWRPLSSWGTFDTKVLQTQTNDNQLVMVMFECGNIVTLNDFKITQPQPASDLQILKSNSPTGEVRSGDVITYTLAFTNKGGPAVFFNVFDVLPSNVSFVGSSHGNWRFENNSPTLRWDNGVAPFYTFGNTDALGTPGFITVQARVNDRVPSGTTICNTAYLVDVPSGGTSARRSSETQVCNTVVVSCPNGQILNDDGLTCEAVAVPDAICKSLTGNEVVADQTHRKFTFTANAVVVNGATIQSYAYDFGDGNKKTNNTAELQNSVDHEFSKAGSYDVSVLLKSSVADKPTLTCKTKVTVNPEEKSYTLQVGKTAANITKKITDANGTTAGGGDVIEYTLTTKNISDVDAKDAILQPEDLTDVLEYADLDMNTLQGGVFDLNTKVLSWNNKVEIKAGQTVTKTFKVRVKDPIPSSPSPDTTNKSAGDLVMHNCYGKDSCVDIKLPGTPIKTIEKTTTTLPNTGPGTSLVLGFVTMTIVGYFFARSRLLATELELVKDEYATSGGAQ